MLSHRAPELCRGVKCFPGLGNDFTRVQNAFPVWETTLQGCKMLSQHGKLYYKENEWNKKIKYSISGPFSASTLRRLSR